MFVSDVPLTPTTSISQRLFLRNNRVFNLYRSCSGLRLPWSVRCQSSLLCAPLSFALAQTHTDMFPFPPLLRPPFVHAGILAPFWLLLFVVSLLLLTMWKDCQEMLNATTFMLSLFALDLSSLSLYMRSCCPLAPLNQLIVFFMISSCLL